MASKRDNNEMAENMCIYLLEELQPALMTRMKAAIDAFDQYYFRVKPELKQNQIEALLRGYRSKKGLIHACGYTSWKGFQLKKAAGKAIELLVKLLDPDLNPHAVLFRKVFMKTPASILKLMKIDKHLSASSSGQRGNKAAAQKISLLLQKRQSTAGLTIVTTVLPEKPQPTVVKPAIIVNSSKSDPKVKSKFGAAWSVLANFFSKRPDAASLKKRGVLKSGKVFGRPLKEVCATGINGIPKVLVMCATFLKEHGLEEPGLFRVSGQSDRIQYLKKCFDFDDDVTLKGCDIHTVSGLMKLYLREMCEPLLPYTMYQPMVDFYRNEQFAEVEKLSDTLVSPNRECFQYLLTFLAQVAQNEDINKMTPSNLAIVFAPNLLRPEIETYEAIARDTPMTIGSIKLLIQREVNRLKQLVRTSIHKTPPTVTTNKLKYGTAPTNQQRIVASPSQVDGVNVVAELLGAKKTPTNASQEEKKLNTTVTTTNNREVKQILPPNTTATKTDNNNNDNNNNNNNNVLPKPWVEYPDPKTGMSFYYNPETKVTQWNRPGGKTIIKTKSSKHHDSDIDEGFVDFPRGSNDNKEESDDDDDDDITASGPPITRSKTVDRNSLVLKLPHKHEKNPSRMAEELNINKQPMSEPKSNPSSPVRESKAELPTGWTKHIDPSTGKTFYYNDETKESSWTIPTQNSNNNNNNKKNKNNITNNDKDETPKVERKLSSNLYCVDIFGGWDEKSCGGCHPNFRSWRENPQYVLTVEGNKDNKYPVTIKMERTSDTNILDDSSMAIGFYVFRKNINDAQKLVVSDADHITRSDFVTDIEAVSSFHVDGNSQYILIPSTYKPGYVGTFSIQVQSDISLQSKLVLDSERWLCSLANGEWKGKSAGGCRNHNTWEHNPQYLLTLGENSESGGPATIVVSQKASNSMKAIGFYVLNNEGEICGKGAFMRAPEVFFELNMEKEKAPYLVVPCTFDAGVEQEYALAVYSPRTVAASLVETV